MDEIIDESFFTDELDSKKIDVEVQKTGFENAFNDKQVGSITIAIEPISGRSGLDVALERFESESDLQAIPIEDDDRVIGIIERKVVEESTNSALKRFVSKTCADYANQTSFYLNCNDFIEKIAVQANNVALKENIHYVIVRLNNRSYYGIVSIEAINTKIAELREDDLQKAQNIQQNMLKVVTETKNLPFDVCIWNKMANPVGGDFYVSQELSENKFLVGCFDVSGKNVSAALLTITLASYFNMLKKSNKNFNSSSGLIANLDTYLKDIVPVGNFITGCVCFIDRTNSRIELYNCGHTNSYVFMKTETGNVKIASLKPTMPPFGIGAVYENIKENKITSYKMPLKNGMQINLYSDGLLDMQREDGTRYDDENTKDFFKKVYVNDVYSFNKFVEKEVSDWVGKALLPDDITIINIRF